MHGQGGFHYGSHQDTAHWEAVLQDARTAERAAAHAVNMARRHLVRLARGDEEGVSRVDAAPEVALTELNQVCNRVKAGAGHGGPVTISGLRQGLS